VRIQVQCQPVSCARLWSDLYSPPHYTSKERGLPTIIAALITERPLCPECVSSKAGVTLAELGDHLERMRLTIIVHHAVDRCRACGRSTAVLSLTRSAS
jgi:hypothetical protein